VKFSVPDDVVLKIDENNQRARDLSNLVLSQVYEETFFIAYAVYGSEYRHVCLYMTMVAQLGSIILVCTMYRTS